jgi:hypothetical protein
MGQCVVYTCRPLDRWNWKLYLIQVAVTEYDDFLIDVLINWVQNRTHKSYGLSAVKRHLMFVFYFLKKMTTQFVPMNVTVNHYCTKTHNFPLTFPYVSYS